MKVFELLTELNIDNNTGWGRTPNNAEIDYFGFRVSMKPSVFLKLAAPLDEVDQAKINTFKDRELSNGGFASPMLYIGIPNEWRDGDFSTPGHIVSHEGRHRMITQQEIYGDTPVETHIILRSRNLEWRGHHVTPEIMAALNKQLVSEMGKAMKGPFFSAN